MIFPDWTLRKYLVQHGKWWLLWMKVEKEHFFKHVAHAADQHEEESDQELKTRALFRIACKKKFPKLKFLVVLGLILISVVVARCQTNVNIDRQAGTKVDATGLPVKCLSGCGGGTTTVVQPTASSLNALVTQGAAGASPWLVSGAVTVSWASAQHIIIDSGTTAVTGTFWQTTQPISGSISNAFLLDATFTGRIPVLGQKAMSGSVPVVIASDQSSLAFDPQGPDAQAATQTGKPVQNGGLNYSDGKIYTLGVDSSGRQQMAIVGTVTLGNLPPQPFLNASDFNDVVAGTPVLGDIIGVNSTPKWQRIAGNVAVQPSFLNSTGNASVSALPGWTSSSGSGNVALVTGAALNPATLDGTTVVYVSQQTTFAAAVAAACTNGIAYGKVILPIGTTVVTADVQPNANCTIEGKGPGSILQANASLTGGLLFISTSANITLRDFTIDCNRAANANTLTGVTIQLTTGVTMERLKITNCLGTGLSMGPGVSNVLIDKSEFSNNGAALPSPSGAGIGIAAGGGAGNTHIRVQHSRIHDNNQGVAIFNSSVAANLTEDITFTGNQVYANANEGMSANSSNVVGGKILGLRFIDNESYCNGWPANGTGFSANCTAGLLQTGSSNSSSGVGIDIISTGLILGVLIESNRLHDNVYDGVSVAGQLNSVVNTSASTVTWVSGQTFNTAWKANTPVLINGLVFLVNAVASTTSLTTKTAPGTLTGVAMVSPSVVRASIIGNNARNNGAIAGVGAGFWNASADQNTYSGNIAELNNVQGFGCNLSSFLSYSGDKAFKNNRGGGATPWGFSTTACQENEYIGITADDDLAVPTQTTGMLLDANSNSNFVITGSLFGTTAALTDNGVTTEYWNGAALKFPANGNLDLSATPAATGFKVPVAAGAAPTVSGNLGYDSTKNTYVGGVNAVTKNVVMGAIAPGGLLVLPVTSNFVTAANTNLQTITGLSFTFPATLALVAKIDCDLLYSQQTAAVADAFGFQDATVAPTNLAASGFVQTAVTTWVDSTLTASATTTATNIVAMTPSAITTIWHAQLHILNEHPSNASTSLFSVMAKTGTAADTLTVFRGSACTVSFQ